MDNRFQQSRNTAHPEKAPFPDGSLRLETLKWLEFAVRRDREKGGDGLRTTRDVADYHGITSAQAARLLEAMEQTGEVECIGKVSGVRLWGATDAGLTAALSKATGGQHV